LTIISVATPLEVLITVPIYLAARVLPDEKRRRLQGCFVAFLIWLGVTMGTLIPAFAFGHFPLQGTIELFMMIFLIMIADIGYQFRTIKRNDAFRMMSL
jgi:hypothetical protein